MQPQEGFFITLFRNHLFGNEHRNIEEQFPVIHGVRTAPYKIYHGCGIRSIDISLVRPVIVAENGLAQVPRLPITRHIIAKVNTEIVIIIRVGVIVAVRNRQSLRFAGIEPFCSTIAITLVEVIYQGMRQQFKPIILLVRISLAVFRHRLYKEGSATIHIEEWQIFRLVVLA